jgi:hypothetical protein
VFAVGDIVTKNVAVSAYSEALAVYLCTWRETNSLFEIYKKIVSSKILPFFQVNCAEWLQANNVISR